MGEASELATNWMYIVKKYGQAQISGLGKKGTRGATN